jgi:hypothetical protein
LKCTEWGVDHEIPPNGFPVMQALCEIIEAQIGSLDFGMVHKEATESCHLLSQHIQDMERLLSDPSAYTYDEIGRLKNKYVSSYDTFSVVRDMSRKKKDVKGS